MSKHKSAPPAAALQKLEPTKRANKLALREPEPVKRSENGDFEPDEKADAFVQGSNFANPRSHRNQAAPHQMVNVNQMAQRFLRRSLADGQPSEFIDANVLRATRLVADQIIGAAADCFVVPHGDSLSLRQAEQLATAVEAFEELAPRNFVEAMLAGTHFHGTSGTATAAPRSVSEILRLKASVPAFFGSRRKTGNN